jgi:MoaA/NifB/PqqE/SkfB family radical SAM enzyme
MEKRVDIKVGFSCNNNCRFCVQGHKRNWGDKTTEQIKNDLAGAKKTKCEGVVFTGGEVTIRKDIFEIVEYAKELGFNTIQIQTNGRMLAYMGFCKKLVRAGVTEFGPALHGHCAELHDFLTNSSGSFKQTVSGIKNIKKLGFPVITNTVVTKPNYTHIPEIAKLLVSLDVNQFQFAFVHPLGNAYTNFDSIVPKTSLAAPYIQKGLQIGIDAGKVVMAEAMPYCLMKGYEKYLSEMYIPPTEIRDAGYIIKDFDEERKTRGKTKFPKCKRCKHYLVCEGPWKEYPEKMGDREFKPVLSVKK